MMQRSATWLGGLTGSVALHASIGAIYIANLSLDAPPVQSKPTSEMHMETVETPTQKLAASDPETEDATQAQGESASVLAGQVPQSQALPTAPESQTAALLPAQGTSALVSGTTAPVLNAVRPQSETVSETAGRMTVSPVAEPVTETANVVIAPFDNAFAVPANTTQMSAQVIVPDQPAPETRPEMVQAVDQTVDVSRPLQQSNPAATIVNSVAVAATGPVAESQPEPVRLAGANALIAETVTAVATDAVAPNEPALPVVRSKAALAWQFSDRVVTDPQALKTIQAFMSPQSFDRANEVKDGLGSVLTTVDCARLSATFIPETGTLQLRGHIPDPAFAATIVASMQEQVGKGIPVTANLLHLPKPQCGALTGISKVGLPQSTDQFTNERLIGKSAHVRDYTYTDGQRLQFDLVAPDYDAFVYVDYFTADGQVIHLVPNETIKLELTKAKSVFSVGQDRTDRPSLVLTIAPPFGQEIAVAFAGSRPLYDGVRPMIEPAEAYLEWLQAKVLEARNKDPDFKGEWVYFFITTKASAQDR